MEIKDYLTILASKIWLLILGALLAAAACYIVASNYTSWPAYEASGTLLIQSQARETQSHNKQELVIYQRTLSALATRLPLTQNVVDKLELTLTEKELADLIRIQTPDDTPIIEIYVTHKDAQTAAAIVDAVIWELHSYEELNIKTTVLAPATVPETPQIASYLLILIAGATGAAIAVGGVLLVEYFNDLVRHERDIVQQLEIPMLGHIQQSSNQSEDITPKVRNAYQWLFAKIYIENGHIPNSILITSPQPCTQQAEFVSMFIHCNLRHNMQGNTHPVRSLWPGNLKRDLVQNHLGTDIDTEFDSEVQTIVMEGSTYNLDVVEKPINLSKSAEKRQSRIVDGPPILSHVNTVMISKRFDCVLMVLDARTTRISDTRKANRLLKEAGAHVIGAVLLS